MRFGGPAPSVGDVRLTRKFLLYPRRLGGPEWRWLEHAYVVEELRYCNKFGDTMWFELRFATDNDMAGTGITSTV